MRSTPLNGLGSVGKMSPRNFDVCPDPARLIDAGLSPVMELPSHCVNSNVTVAVEDDVFATAIPLWMLFGCPDVPEDSAYIRNAVPVVTGTPASETVIAPGLYEKTTNAVGAAPAVGTTRTDPVATTAADPVVASFCELRGATEYAKVLLV